MGREIRKVIPNWEHPRRDCKHSPWAGGCDDARQNDGKCFQPMYDEDYESAMAEFIENHNLWLKGEHPDQKDKDWDVSGYRYYAQWNGNAPDVEYYRPKWTKEEATWFQLYETISEGTPVSPAFATQEELIEYLVINGDFWDQQRGEAPYSRRAAEKMVRGGWALSAISVNGQFYSGAEGLAALETK